MNRLYFISTPALLAAMVLAGCGRKTENASANSLPPVAVRVQVAESKSRVATEEEVGTVRAKLHAAIEAKISGKIEQMLVVAGQRVTNGELLAVIDAREIQAQCDQAAALRQQAESDLKRATNLFGQNILSQSEFDGTQSKFRVADAAASQAKTLLGYAKVSAPFKGVITRKAADVGDLAAPGKSLLEMEDPGHLRLEADVPEALVDKIKLGDTAARPHGCIGNKSHRRRQRNSAVRRHRQPHVCRQAGPAAGVRLARRTIWPRRRSDRRDFRVARSSRGGDSAGTTGIVVRRGGWPRAIAHRQNRQARWQRG